MIQNEEDIRRAGRVELEEYLEAWGFQVYDHETTETLREAALENFHTENR